VAAKTLLKGGTLQFDALEVLEGRGKEEPDKLGKRGAELLRLRLS
jgi:hypothetical protein